MKTVEELIIYITLDIRSREYPLILEFTKEEDSTFIYENYLRHLKDDEILKTPKGNFNNYSIKIDPEDDMPDYLDPLIENLISIPSLKGLYLNLRHFNLFNTKFQSSLKKVKELKYLSIYVLNYKIYECDPFLPELKHLEEFTLQRVKISENINQVLKSTKLKKLHLIDCSFYYLFDFNFSFNNIEDLSIDTDDDFDFFKMIFNCLKENKSLKKFYFKNPFKVKKQKLNDFLKLLNQTSLKECSLDYIEFYQNDEDFEYKSDLKILKLGNVYKLFNDNFLKMNPNLEELHFKSYSPFIDSYLSNIGNIKTLSLFNSSIKYKDSLFDIIQNNETISTLDISSLRIEEKLIKGDLTDAFKENSTLTSLEISRWEPDMLIFMKSLEVLKINSYQFSLEELPTFFKQVKDSKLKHLKLETNHDDFIDIIKDFISSNPKLTKFQVITSSDVNEKFFECLYQNTNLKSLKVFNMDYFQLYFNDFNEIVIHNLFLFNHSLLKMNFRFPIQLMNIQSQYLNRNMLNRIINDMNLKNIKNKDIQFYF